MLPWNPPSSFSAGSDSSGGQQQQYRPNYSQEQQQQQQQPQQQQQQQGQNQQQPGQQQQGAPPPAYPPMTLASTLHFLQSEHRRYARDRNEWEIERAEMRARVALLEGEKRGNEGALRDLGRRCKMLENALRGERSKFLSTTNALAAGHSPSPSGTSSPVHIPAPAASGIPPAKAAQLLSNLNPAKDATAKDSGAATPAPESAAMAPSTSSPGTAASAPAVTIQGLGHQSRASSSLGVNGGTLNGTWGSGAGTLGGAAGTFGAGRDPRGKARSRDYLKQCLQEITYLTSATTLNPLAATSYSAPNVPRPRKVLPDHLPAPGAPGVFNVSFPPRAEAPPAATAPLSIAAGAPPAPTPAPAPPLSGAFELPPQQHPAPPVVQPHPITKFPSDPASAFVPLKRTISQPGVPGGPGSVRGAAVASDPFTPQIEKKVEEEKGEGEGEAPVEAAETAAQVDEGKTLDVVAEKEEKTVEDEEKGKDDAGSTAAAEVRHLPTRSASADFLPDPSSSSPSSHESSDDRSFITTSTPFTNGVGDREGANTNDLAGGVERGSAAADQQDVGPDGQGEGGIAIARGGRRGAGKAAGAAGPRGDDKHAATVRRHGGADSGGGEFGGEGGVGEGVEEAGDAGSRLTAIFRPESDQDWQEQLKRAGEGAYPAPRGGGGVSGRGTIARANLGKDGEEDELAGLEWLGEEDEGAGKEGEEKEGPSWRARVTLRSHLDAVRALAFVHETSGDKQLSIVSGGDDMTVKVWRHLNVLATARPPADIEPILTYRGHTAPITSLAVSASTGLIFSGSLDSDIRIWRLPAPIADTYDPVNLTLHVGTLRSEGGDAVWGLQLFSTEHGEERLAAISADGMVRVWDVEKRECVAMWGYEGGAVKKEGSLKRRKVVPTAICLVEAPAQEGQVQLAVAYFDSVVKVFDASSGEEMLKLESAETYDGTPQTQINSIASHPSRPLLATAHEDKFIRLFDLASGNCLHSILAHLDGVTSLCFLSSGTSLASVGHDTSLRFWNLDLVCTQEIASHRATSTEGILDVIAGEEVVVSAGADGTVRLWVRE